MMYNFSEVLTNVTLGADPEVFVRYSDGTLSSAIGKIGGSKEHPKPVRLGAIQEDNVLAEFNIDPASSKEEFIHNIKTVLSELEIALEVHKLEALIQSSHTYEIDQLLGWGDKALEFGCGAEWDAYTQQVKKAPNGALGGLRTAGGHIHVGYDDPFELGNYSLGRMMDFALGIPSVLMDTDTGRRALYGQAGAIRHKPYGVEYRTLSNFWIKSEELMAWAYEQTLWSTQNLDKLDDFLLAVPEKKLQKIINKSNKASALAICRELGLEVA
jgi:hypothetical protein